MKKHVFLKVSIVLITLLLLAAGVGVYKEYFVPEVYYPIPESVTELRLPNGTIVQFPMDEEYVSVDLNGLTGKSIYRYTRDGNLPVTLDISYELAKDYSSEDSKRWLERKQAWFIKNDNSFQDGVEQEWIVGETATFIKRGPGEAPQVAPVSFAQCKQQGGSSPFIALLHFVIDGYFVQLVYQGKSSQIDEHIAEAEQILIGYLLQNS